MRLDRLLLSASLLQCAGLASAVTSSGNSTDPTRVPLEVENNCPDAIWPGIGTQNGDGPGTGGFFLDAGKVVRFTVSWDWQGRVWGRTNCSFNANGTGPANLNGVDGNGASCLTGDCWGTLDCVGTGAVPSTLAEFNLRGGVNQDQTFYDLSLVDGYNLPVGIEYIPCDNTTDIPPNLTNPSCIGTAGFLAAPARSGYTYTNATYPMPYEKEQTNDAIADWCPWPLQKYPPSKPGDGVYPYPDDNVQRPAFDPCLSACASSGSDADCCTGKYNDPSACPKSLYSQNAKAVCPDAYSYAFDDQTSTFILPSCGGFRVIFCPAGRSTNILQTFGAQLAAVASRGHSGSDILAVASNMTFIESMPSRAGLPLRPPVATGSLVLLSALTVLVVAMLS